MDPNGIRDCFLLENVSSPPFRVARAVRSLPVRMRVTKSQFRGIHLPLTYPLPARIDTTFQGRRGLFAFDLVALVNVDPQVLTPQEQLNLTAYVEQGGGLLICGGPASLGAAAGSHALWEDLLPVRVIRGGGERAEIPLRGTPALQAAGAFGPPAGGAHLQPVEVRPGSEVWLRADDRPVLVTGHHAGGRVAVWTGYPSLGTPDREPFFWSDTYEDIQRELLLWLLDAPERVTITGYVPPAAVVTPGEPIHATVAADLTGSYRLTLHRDDTEVGQAETAAGGESELVITTPPELRWDELLDYCLDVIDETGQTRARRTGQVLGRPATGLAIRFPHDISIFEIGKRIAFRVEACGEVTESEVRAFLHDEDGAQTTELGSAILRDGAADFSAQLPELALGPYRLVVQTDEAEAREWIVITEPLDRNEFFLTKGYGPARSPDPEQSRERFVEYLSRNFTGWVGGSAEEIRGLDDPNRGLLLASLQREQATLNPVRLHGFDPRDPFAREPRQLSEPCVMSPEFAESVDERVAREIDRLILQPRLYSVEIYSEPFITHMNICRCQYCLEAFREEYGFDMPEYLDVALTDDPRKYALFAWMGNYVERGWRALREALRRAGGDFPLNVTFASVATGEFVPEQGYTDAFRWSSVLDLWDIDPYPRMYPNGRATRELPMNECHYHWGFHRTLAQYRGCELGVWVDGTDRDDPVRVVSKKTSRELFLTALAQGAGYVRTFCHAGGNGQGAREERRQDYAEILGQVRAIHPLLKHARRPLSRVAQVHPETHWIMDPARKSNPPGYEGWGYWTPMDHYPKSRWYPYAYDGYNVSELIARAWGDCDVLHEKLLETDFLDGYGAVALNGAKWLRKAAAHALVEFVRAGGLLICDILPTHDEHGERLRELNFLPSEGEETWIIDDLNCTLGRFGAGTVLRFNQNLNEAYSAAVERGDREARRRIETVIQDALSRHDLRPLATSSDPEVESAVRIGEDFALAFAVNHAADDRRITLALPSLAFRPGWAVDALTSEAIPLSLPDDIPTLDLDVPAIDGRIITLYPNPIAGLDCRVAPGARPGGQLAYTLRVLGPDGQPARGRQVLHITVTDPRGRSRPRYGGDRATQGGVYQGRFPVAINELPGAWNLEACDPLGRRMIRQAFTVES